MDFQGLTSICTMHIIIVRKITNRDEMKIIETLWKCSLSINNQWQILKLICCQLSCTIIGKMHYHHWMIRIEERARIDSIIEFVIRLTINICLLNIALFSLSNELQYWANLLHACKYEKAYINEAALRTQWSLFPKLTNVLRYQIFLERRKYWRTVIRYTCNWITFKTYT